MLATTVPLTKGFEAWIVPILAKPACPASPRMAGSQGNRGFGRMATLVADVRPFLRMRQFTGNDSCSGPSWWNTSLSLRLSTARPQWPQV